ncbi:MAG: hypothetical protein M3O09_07410 [Acidobacteriota bacterium]|jgi:hypothetical protein|nr:hypothetical protein [Acidobacteriota bacterium]
MVPRTVEVAASLLFLTFVSLAMVTRHVISERAVLTLLGTGLILVAVIIRRHLTQTRKDVQRLI